MEKQEKEVSKFLSFILCHKPEVIGISVDEHGWVNADELLTSIKRTITIDVSM